MTTLCDRIRAGLARGRVVRGVTPYTATTFDRSVAVDQEHLATLAPGTARTQDGSAIRSLHSQVSALRCPPVR
jgi:hypothetical protein